MNSILRTAVMAAVLALLSGCTNFTSMGKTSKVDMPAPQQNRPTIVIKDTSAGPLHLGYTLQKSKCFSRVSLEPESGDLHMKVAYRDEFVRTSPLEALSILTLGVVPEVMSRKQAVDFTVTDAKNKEYHYKYVDGIRTWTGWLVPAPVFNQADKTELERENLRRMCGHLLNDMARDGLLSQNSRGGPY
jgi:hypothetical protein